MTTSVKKNSASKEDPPTLDPATDDGSDDNADDEYDAEEEYDSEASDSDGDDISLDDDADDGSDDEFEDQGSSDDEDSVYDSADEGTYDERGEEAMERLEVMDLGGSSEEEGDGGRKRAEEGTRKTDVDAPRANTWTVSPSDGITIEKSGVLDPAVAASVLHAEDVSSDEDDLAGTSNRIGRVPLHWYDGLDHIGYDVSGKKMVPFPGILDGREGGGVDRLLAAHDDPKLLTRTVRDVLNGRDVTMDERTLEVVRRIAAGAYAHPEHEAYPDYVDYFSGVNKEISGLHDNVCPPKRAFLPDQVEAMKVRHLLNKLKKGQISMDYLKGKVKSMSEKKDPEDTDEPNRSLWTGDEEDTLHTRHLMHIAPPKAPPPGHALSYNPPEEYLPNDNELQEWENLDAADRPHGLVIPKKFESLRTVGAYEHAVRERFERCLDLYLCPRIMKRRLNIDPESLVPSLPKAADLRPFPTAKCVQYYTPTENEVAPRIRCLAVSPDGQYLASGAEDGVVRMWESATGRLLRSWDVSALASSDLGRKTDAEGKKEDAEAPEDAEAEAPQAMTHPVVSLAWNPEHAHHVLLAAVGTVAAVIATGTDGASDAPHTDALLAAACKTDGKGVTQDRAAKAVAWQGLLRNRHRRKVARDLPLSSFAEFCGPVALLRLEGIVTQVRWHRKGDYFLTVSPECGAAAVLLHQLSKASTQQPFGKVRGQVQCAAFHSSKPFLFVASQTDVKIYHLVKQNLVKRLLPGCKWISSLDVHRSGDHVVLGSLDRRVLWFDLDLSSTPYKTLRYHTRAVRTATYHPRFPLMASSSDDGSVHVFHATVYGDLMRNPLVVPVKVLRGHEVVGKVGVLATAFHPTQPWLFSAGADGRIHLWQDI